MLRNSGLPEQSTSSKAMMNLSSTKTPSVVNSSVSRCKTPSPATTPQSISTKFSSRMSSPYPSPAKLPDDESVPSPSMSIHSIDPGSPRSPTKEELKKQLDLAKALLRKERKNFTSSSPRRSHSPLSHKAKDPKNAIVSRTLRELDLNNEPEKNIPKKKPLSSTHSSSRMNTEAIEKRNISNSSKISSRPDQRTASVNAQDQFNIKDFQKDDDMDGINKDDLNGPGDVEDDDHVLGKNFKGEKVMS